MAKNKLNYSEEDIEQLFVNLYNGDIDPTLLPKDLYLAIGKFLFSGVKEGFDTSVEFGKLDEELLAELRENVYLFSAAKTFQQTEEMSSAMYDEDGNLLPFKDFKVAANGIFVKYNGGEIDDEIKPGWLEAEYNSAIAQANNAKKWNQIEKKKKLFPYLVYNALDTACEICAPLNGVCLPVDDPFWDQYMPENHFNCICIVEQVEREEGEDDETDADDLEEAVAHADEKVPDTFKYNPGKQKEVFSTEGKSQHPYFQVPKEYSKFAEKNFGLEIPEEE